MLTSCRSEPVAIISPTVLMGSLWRPDGRLCRGGGTRSWCRRTQPSGSSLSTYASGAGSARTFVRTTPSPRGCGRSAWPSPVKGDAANAVRLGVLEDLTAAVYLHHGVRHDDGLARIIEVVQRSAQGSPPAAPSWPRAAVVGAEAWASPFGLGDELANSGDAGPRAAVTQRCHRLGPPPVGAPPGFEPGTCRLGVSLDLSIEVRTCALSRTSSAPSFADVIQHPCRFGVWLDEMLDGTGRRAVPRHVS